MFLLCPVNDVQGQTMPPLVYASTLHIVQPGETLFSIAGHYGMDSRSLMRLNDLADPRKIYPGQRLHILAIVDGVDVSHWVQMPVSIEDDFLSLARRGNVPWEVIAAANHSLGVGNLLVGQVLYLPGSVPARKIVNIHAGDTFLASALRYGISWWQLQQLNSYAGYIGGSIVVPADSMTVTV
ncbi:MAG: LysM peptidoglycan-binding domain-containing protein, partial [Anaerolineae bacterium]|nr:LysM peptidoglycan-binding domain-containing protein [Anaerolineae bacterium]